MGTIIVTRVDIMPGPIRHYKRDPNARGRGSGKYYHRGRGYFSKYSAKRDKKVDSKGKDPIGEGRYRHTDDLSGKKARKRGRVRPKPPRRGRKGASAPKNKPTKSGRGQRRRKDGKFAKRPGPKQKRR